MALAAAEYAKKKGIPFVPDVNDLWPEAMRMVLDIPVVSDILFYPLKRDAEKVYSLVSGIIGTSDEYRDRPLKNQKLDVPRKTVYVGNEIAEFDKGVETYGPQIRNQKESSGFLMRGLSEPAMISGPWCWRGKNSWTGEWIRLRSRSWEEAL